MSVFVSSPMIVCSFARCSKKEERKKGKGQALDFGGKYVDTMNTPQPQHINSKYQSQVQGSAQSLPLT
jgi:hypothetical protein